MAQKRDFMRLLRDRWSQNKFVCVGLDPRVDRLPKHLRKAAGRFDPGDAVYAFNEAIIEATRDLVCAYKVNSAFYHALSDESGTNVLAATIGRIHTLAPDVPVILDAKYGDIAETNEMHAVYAFDILQADAVTVHPYMGLEALKPFFERADKGVFVLCRTSNPGAELFQGGIGGVGKLYRDIATNVAYAGKLNQHQNCGLVMGAKDSTAIRNARTSVARIRMPFLIPGIGAQGGDLAKAVTNGIDADGKGIIVNASRGIIHASSGKDFAEAARRETLTLDKRIRNIIDG